MALYPASRSPLFYMCFWINIIFLSMTTFFERPIMAFSIMGIPNLKAFLNSLSIFKNRPFFYFLEKPSVNCTSWKSSEITSEQGNRKCARKPSQFREIWQNQKSVYQTSNIGYQDRKMTKKPILQIRTKFCTKKGSCLNKGIKKLAKHVKKV